ncbi:MAG: hypothetical protein IKC86_00100 [Prevotella sp.]|nr:hypothetical protein [Prevotella sp.]
MKLDAKRYFASWMMLAVFVPMLLLSSLHVHTAQSDDAGQCAECVRHQCHGHLTLSKVTAGDCVLCQFLMLTLVAAATIAFVCCQLHTRFSGTSRCPAALTAQRGFVGLRAPPVCT